MVQWKILLKGETDIRAERRCMRVGGLSKNLKREWNRKEGREDKDFKKEGQARSRGGCLKNGGLEPPHKL